MAEGTDKNMKQQPRSTVKVACIIGKGLSGTTLLTHILGAHSATVNVGEINNLRRMARYHKDKPCSDGIAFDKHPFWLKVIDYLKAHGISEPPKLRTSDHEVFKANNSLVFDAISNSSGGKVIIETCKNTGRVRKLNKYFHGSMLFIHLVKDPRSYALSNDKRGSNAAQILRKLFNWNLKETYYYFWMRWSGMQFIDVKYETLVTTPEKELERIMSFLGLQMEGVQLEYYKIPQPAFWGNRMMLNEKADIRLNTDYLDRISPVMWFLYTLLSLPGCLFNRYPLRRKLPALTERN